MRLFKVEKTSLRATKGSAAIQDFIVKTPRNNKPRERGAVFIYILMAIALFAGLSYAVSRGSRGGTSNLTDQQAKLAAQEIIDYGNTVAQAVQKLRLRGVQEHEFDFSNNVFKLVVGTSWPTANGTCTSNQCKLFNINGGNIDARYAPKIAQIDNVLGGGSTAGQGNFRTNVILNVGSSEVDINFEYTYITKQVCTKINELLNITNPGGDPPVDDYNGGQANYSGTLTSVPKSAGAAANPIGDDIPELAGKNAFCLNSGSGYYNYKQVLIAR